MLYIKLHCFCSTLQGGKITTEERQAECHNIVEDIKRELQCSMTVKLNTGKHFYYRRECQHEKLNT